MGYILLAAQRVLWGLFRLFGLACLSLALLNATITLQLQQAFAPLEDQMPFFAICLALFAGTLFLLPSTTPAWIRTVRCPASATVAIAAFIGLAVALVAGTKGILPYLAPAPRAAMLGSVLADLVVLFTAAGVVTAGGLGLFTPRRRRRAVPLSEDSAAQQAQARLLRQARS